jgi:K+-transporting ATPase ATPase A chain
MNVFGWLQVIIFLVVILALAKPLGSYMARVYGGERTLLHPVLGPVERFIYRLAGVKPESEMSWKDYTLALLLFNVLV